MESPSPLQVIPEDRAGRWDRLREFVGHWYSPLGPDDGDPPAALDAGEARLGVALPRALREWYGLAGRRAEIWSRRDTFVRPEDLEVEDGRLVVYVENQAVVRWGIRIADAPLGDPPVFVSSADDPGAWIEEAESTSMFALQMLISCLKWSRGHRAWARGELTGAALGALASRYPRLPFRESSWSGAARYYGHRDLVAEANLGEGSLWVGARTEAAFADLDRRMAAAGMRWDARSDEWPPGWVSRALGRDG